MYVRAFPTPSSGQGGRWLISKGGGNSVFWLRNGHDLVYRGGGDILSCELHGERRHVRGRETRVWIGKLASPVWDRARNGKRVLVLIPAESAAAPKPEHEVAFLQNFFDELRRKVPVGK